jgi:isoamylase
MLLAGDEMGRTQHGNNNAYCQDSPLSWVDWSLAQQNSDLLRFTCAAFALRAAHPVFRRRRFFDGHPPAPGRQPAPDIAWLTPSGTEMTAADWDSGFGRSLAVFLNGARINEPGPRGERIRDDSFLLCFNAHDAPIGFTLPGFGARWAVALDCSAPAGQSRDEYDAAAVVQVPARCLLVLRLIEVSGTSDTVEPGAEGAAWATT